MFRGKSTKDGTWVYGSYEEIMQVFTPRPIAYIHSLMDWNLNNTIEVYDDTVSQSTGLKDKNGKMIYEGDIIKMRYPYDKRYFGKFVVVKDFDSPKFGLLDKTKTNEVFDLYSHMSNHYEVIGNINLNPELLENKND